MSPTDVYPAASSASLAAARASTGHECQWDAGEQSHWKKGDLPVAMGAASTALDKAAVMTRDANCMFRVVVAGTAEQKMDWLVSKVSSLGEALRYYGLHCYIPLSAYVGVALFIIAGSV
jgi:hypothetical protein